MLGFEEVRAAPSNYGGGADALSVPLDICRELFLRLPPKSLIRFRAVCKGWRAAIDDPCFVKAHTNNQLSSNTIIIRNSTGPPFHPLYSFDLDALNFTNGLQTIAVDPLDFTLSGLSLLPALPVAACNGLMLLVAPECREKKKLEIRNPLTHERLELPLGKYNSNIEAIGLGYDYADDDFKAVVIDRRSRRLSEEYVYRTHVYSLKSDSWRRIGNCPCANWPGPKSPGVFVSGALHWLSPLDKIIALDLGTENYGQLRMPPVDKSEEIMTRENHLDVLGGCLVLSYYGKDAYEDQKHFDVWMMKYYGAEDSWMKLFSIEKYSIIHHLGRSLRPVACMKNKMQFFLQDDMGFYLFDVESNSAKMVSIHGLSGDLYAQIIPGNILRLHDNCGVSGSVTTQRRRRRKRKRKSKMKMCDTELYFCLKNAHFRYARESHDSCYGLDFYSSSENQD